MALEQETREICRILTERTIGEYSRYRLDLLTAADVPRGIKSFFKAEVRRRLEKDLAKAPWFAEIQKSDLGSARVAQTLLSSLMDAFPFNRQDFLDKLELAVHFLANYLYRPRWTLENFLFDRESPVSFEAVARGFSYVDDYRYLGEIALELLRRRGQNEITREEFRTLIARIDDEVVGQHAPRELALLASPLFGFFEVAGGPVAGAIPVEALALFLDDKGIGELEEYLRGICHLRNQTHITAGDFAQIIEDMPDMSSTPALAGVSAPEPTSNAQEVAIGPQDQPAASQELPSAAQEAGSEPEAPVTAPQAPEDAPPAPGSIIQGPEKTPLPDTARERGLTTSSFHRNNIALSLTFAGMQETPPPRAALAETASLIPPEQRDLFIREIFHGDEHQYAETLAALDAWKSWPEAEAYLAEFFRREQMDPGAQAVAAFSDIIRSRYPTAERTQQ